MASAGTNGGNGGGNGVVEGGGGVGGGSVGEKENDGQSPCDDAKPKGNEDFLKGGETQSNVYMGEEEIPIVTRSDELEET